MKFGKIKKLHFVGIGGIGMSGIAEMLHNEGFAITGSDLVATEVTDHLVDLGIKISFEHDAKNVGDAHAVVISSAVHSDNPEVISAVKSRIPVIRRAEMLGELMRTKYGIGIAGTHGKTTTTSMTGYVLTEGGFDPTVIVGGRVQQYGTNVKFGTGDCMVAEADEYDRSFLNLTHSMAVITSLEADHLDYYGSFENIREAFIQFANKVPFYGNIFLNMDDENVVSIIPELKRPIVTFGLTTQADVRASNPTYDKHSSTFKVHHNGNKVGEFTINLPGLFNVRNALAAIAVGLEFEMPLDKIRSALESFQGVVRRFEIKGEEGGVMVVDDYAHHPTEVEVTLRAAKVGYHRPIVAIFQPHLYSRTNDFYREFAKALLLSDMLIVTGIYAAREKPMPGVSGEMIVTAAAGYGHRNCHYVEDMHSIPQFIRENRIDDSIVMTIGAGDIYHIGDDILKELKR
ncbi:MAG: UDP-N-acetylmuramate--L-alanine ligase [Candidatus Zixiibacteriota bacterium]